MTTTVRPTASAVATTGPSGRVRRSRSAARYGTPLSVAGVLVALVAGWQLAVWIGQVPRYQVAAPADAAGAFGSHPSLLAHRIWVTGQGAVLGLAAAAALALTMAVVVLRWPIVRTPLTAYALVFRTLPIVGVAPLFTLVTGHGLGTSVACVVVVTVFTLLISALDGLESVPAQVRELEDLYATPFLRRVRLGAFPSAVGSLLVGLRVAAPMAVLAALLAEWLSGLGGLGSLMTESLANRETDLLWATSVVAALLGLVAYGLPSLLVSWADRRGYAVVPGAGTEGGRP
ncbi:ABC transporter permease [Frankia sp. AgKG'84/4]|uniref:ABC transporter permease n=1 Tax=Frankia sp. AgKG'84/4 TaxID=573490 RepID=UPI00200E004C|nr:ABC transporter permease subunit [Frankia sp. AgKG'84/4]MCL9796605.1 ABC transporter permease subunit [Frankia sp. AgKG'84/4]